MKGVKPLEKMINHESGVLQSQATRKLGYTQQFIFKTLKIMTNI